MNNKFFWKPITNIGRGKVIDAAFEEEERAYEKLDSLNDQYRTNAKVMPIDVRYNNGSVSTLFAVIVSNKPE